MDFSSLVQTLTRATDRVEPSVLLQVEEPLQTPLGLLMGHLLIHSTTFSCLMGPETTLILTTATPTSQALLESPTP